MSVEQGVILAATRLGMTLVKAMEIVQVITAKSQSAREAHVATQLS